MVPSDYPQIDILLVCGARPVLLEKTLESFDKNLFRHFDINNVFANLDLFCGDEQDREKCRDLIIGYFPNAIIRTPAEPSHCGAVKWLWSQVRSDYAFHMEDDWLMNAPIGPDQVFKAFENDRVHQVSILTKEKRWKYRSKYHFKPVRIDFRPLFSFSFLDKNSPEFTTGPCFISQEFAHGASERFDIALDPEKQLFGTLNPSMSKFTSKYLNYLLGQKKPYLISDTGRQYLKARGVEKIVEKGKSIWRNTTVHER